MSRRRSLWRRLRRSLVVTSVLSAAVVLPAGSAGAHSFLAGSAPADGAVLTASPHQLQLRFSESIEVPSTHIDIVGADGISHQPTSIQLVAAGGGPAKAGLVLLVVGLP